jgi:hydrogenase/urease accessory protein HupE
VRWAALFVVWFVQALPVGAHTFAPALLELRQEGEEVLVRFKQPVVRAAGSELRPVLPEGCRAVRAPEVVEEGTGIVLAWRAVCPGGLLGQRVAVEGIAGSRADVLLRIELDDGRSLRHVLTADRPSFVVPGSTGFFDVAWAYGRLGVEHILSGWDHLLFVLGLVLLVPGGRRLVATVTAFTLGHSVTLALASLGVVHVPPGPTEAAIALSIYLLAVELAAGRRGDPGLLARSPWGMAAAFGLLHGLGFAGALSEVGLPEREIPAALFSFNVGIELGQLAFVVVVLLAGWAVARLPERWTERLAPLPVYVIGSLAAFWFFERVAGLF